MGVLLVAVGAHVAKLLLDYKTFGRHWMATHPGRRRAPQRRSEVWPKNALAMLTSGDGVMRIIASQEHEDRCMVGHVWLSRANGIGWLAKNLRYTRLVGATQVGADVWFAVGQYGGT